MQYLACGIPTIATPLEGLMSIVPYAVFFTIRVSEQRALSTLGVTLISGICHWDNQTTALEDLLKNHVHV